MFYELVNEKQKLNVIKYRCVSIVMCNLRYNIQLLEGGQNLVEVAIYSINDSSNI